MKDSLSDYPGYALRRSSVAVMGALATALQQVELRQAESSVLLLIRDNPGITQSQIGRMLDIQRANMAPLVARLAARGLLHKAPVDRRSQGLVLTDVGEALCVQVREIIDSLETRIVESVPAPHRAHLLPALRAIWQAFAQ